MKIIVIGMDNSGKTTLCKDLSKALGYKIINSLGPNKTKEEMINHIQSALSQDNIIMERFPLIEELIYGKVLRGYSKFSLEDPLYREVRYKLPVIIYCRPSNERILDWKDREQMSGVIEKSSRLIKEFDLLFENVLKDDFIAIKWDYEHGTLNQLLSILSHSKKAVDHDD